MAWWRLQSVKLFLSVMVFAPILGCGSVGMEPRSVRRVVHPAYLNHAHALCSGGT
jgi:hypothetical protein